MRDHLAHQADHAERAGPPAIEQGELSDQPQRCREHEQHVDQRAGADGGDDRHPLRGGRDQPPCLFIERAHQFALGELDHVGAVDDVVGMALKRGAGARQLRVLMCKPEEVTDDRAAGRTVVAKQNLRRTQMQFLDRRKSRQPKRFARDDRDQRERGCDSECEPQETETLAARKQVLDQVEDAKTCGEQHQAADGAPEQAAPAKAAAQGNQRGVDGHRQLRGVGLRRDMNSAAGRPAACRRGP